MLGKCAMKDAVNIKWEVTPAPTGRYRSFQRRGWPVGRVNDKNRVLIDCADDYIPANVKTGKHGPLTITIDIFENGETRMAKMKVRADSLVEAKKQAILFFKKNPQFIMPD